MHEFIPYPGLPLVTALLGFCSGETTGDHHSHRPCGLGGSEQWVRYQPCMLFMCPLVFPVELVKVGMSPIIFRVLVRSFPVTMLGCTRQPIHPSHCVICVVGG